MRRRLLGKEHGEIPNHGDQNAGHVACRTFPKEGAGTPLTLRLVQRADLPSSADQLKDQPRGGLFEIRSSCEELFRYRSKAGCRSGSDSNVSAFTDQVCVAPTLRDAVTNSVGATSGLGKRHHASNIS